MVDLNNLEEIKKLDPKDVFGSTKLFVDQCQQMLDEYFDQTILPEDYKEINNVLICAMGGSAFGGYIASSLYSEEFTKPVVLVNDYRLPGFVDENSLVIGVSYSGNTEEIISCLYDGLERGAKVTGFSAGGDVANFLKDKKLPGFTFDPKNNPSGQPRLGGGYTSMGVLILLKHMGVVPLLKQELQIAISEAKSSSEEVMQKAKDYAKQMQNFMPVIFASEFLIGNAHILRNQFNETAKSFSAFEDIPELNHHLMEGLKNPTDKKLKMLFLTSSFYSEKHAKRIAVTEDVVKQNGVEFLEYEAIGNSKLSHILNTLSFGGFLTFYLAALYGQDPSLIPWVDYFKEQLKK